MNTTSPLPAQPVKLGNFAGTFNSAGTRATKAVGHVVGNAASNMAVVAGSAATNLATAAKHFTQETSRTVVTAAENMAHFTQDTSRTVVHAAGNMASVFSAFPISPHSRLEAGSEPLRHSMHTSTDSSSGPTMDFRQRLGLLLATEANAREVACKLFERFEGDVMRLPSIFRLLEERWGFPEQVFPLLSTHLMRAAGTAEEPSHVSMDEWCEAFLRWLQSLRTASSRTKVSRQCFVHARSGDCLRETYLQGAKLGEGAYGEVFVMLHKALGRARVVKVLPKVKIGTAVESIESEVELLKSLDHPHIVRIYETFETADDLNIVMDYAEGGDLASVLRNSPNQQVGEKIAVCMAEQIAAALEYMHAQAVVHCDLKPANVMLLHPCAPDGVFHEMPHVLLADFGLAEIFEGERIGQQVKVKGTPLYLSPEGFEGLLTQKSDMWALGIMIFEILLGRRPFKESKSVFILWSQVAKQTPDLEDLSALSKDVVEALLKKNPKDRLTANECRRLEWFTGYVVEDAQGVVSELGHLSYFQRATMFCIAAGLSVKDMKPIYDLFHSLDKDKTGFLSAEELKQGIAHLGIHQDAETLMAVLDMDQNGRISYTEFLAGAMQVADDFSERLIRYSFDMFDLDGDGYISMHELKLMLSGDGPLVEVLPDGQTVAQVMDEVGGGEGRITFAKFRAYIEKLNTNQVQPALFGCQTGSVLAASGTQSEIEVSPLENEITHLVAGIEDVLPAFGTSTDVCKPFSSKSVKTIRSVKSDKTKTGPPAFEPFQTWLKDATELDQQASGLGCLLTFPDDQLEVLYVTQYMSSTCLGSGLLALCLILNSLASLTFSQFQWAPSLGRWERNANVIYNVAWSSIGLLSMIVLACCCRSWAKYNFLGDGDSFIDDEDLQALWIEYILGIWSCIVPWVICFFANPFRVAALFDMVAVDAFGAVGSDHDVLLVLLGMLAMVSTITYVRFVHALRLASSCCMAYLCSTAFFGLPCGGNECTEEGSFLWPAMLLIILCMLIIRGHYALERSRRLAFLRYHRSYVGLRALDQEFSRRSIDSSAMDETKGKRFKNALEFLALFNDHSDFASQPLQMAFQELTAILQRVKDDVAEADRWFITDVKDALRAHGTIGLARDALLDLFESTVPQDREHRFSKRASELSCVRFSHARFSQIEIGYECGAWGWDVLSNSAARPLLELGQTMVVPLVASSLGPESEAKCHHFMAVLVKTYSRSSRHSEARAVLTLRAAYWLAQKLGLWEKLEPWEQVALVVAAVGLHCAAGGCALTRDDLLTHVTSTSCVLEALDKSHLVVDDAAMPFRHVVCRALMRARPQCMLEDAQKLCVQVNQTGKVSAAQADRAVIISSIVAMASYSFLALPNESHISWANLCKEEFQLQMMPGSEQTLDVAAWLSSLIEFLMLPMHETFSFFTGASTRIEDMSKCLYVNSKTWKNTKLEATSAPHPLPGQVEHSRKAP